MWIRRTSRGRRDLPESRSEVDGIWVGCGGAAFMVLVVVVGPAAWFVVGGSAGGLVGCVVGGWV